MENFVVKSSKTKLFLFFGIFSSITFSIYFFVSAYSPYYTHPDLTEETAKLWNLKNENSDFEISQKEIEWMRDGAIKEDEPPRWINHFYDPVHKTGWSGKHFGNLTPEEGKYQGESMAPKPAIASINWAVNQTYQSAYGRFYGNQTWQKAIKSYNDGDKKSAFIALGHILHLIEDASVPDHTRDDTHVELYGDPGSPYENYSKEYTNDNQGKLNTAENLKDREFFNFAAVQDAFEYLAKYSNANFFSEDTISNEEFMFPELGKLEKKIKNINNKKVLFLYNSQKQIYLAILNDDEKYSTNNKSFILPSYFSHLSQEAVLTGASVLNLFFQQVEKVKQNYELLPSVVEDQNNSALSYLKTSPRLVAVNAADVCDKTGTNIQIYSGQLIGKETSNACDIMVADLENLKNSAVNAAGFVQNYLTNTVGFVQTSFSKLKNNLTSNILSFSNSNQNSNLTIIPQSLTIASQVINQLSSQNQSPSIPQSQPTPPTPSNAGAAQQTINQPAPTPTEPQNENTSNQPAPASN